MLSKAWSVVALTVTALGTRSIWRHGKIAENR
ncbi:hypothetical protein XACM_0123 [Xanthomonas euvesicatoria pv. citrumelo F1]|nr:hypothetical protein XACM_0123 [Xanthomonas euvesicatoria pv. citrumelo F1]